MTAEPLHSIPWQSRTGATLIVDGFKHYNADFRAITRRAERHFIERDWQAQGRDLNQRIELYDKAVAGIGDTLIERLGDAAHRRDIWVGIKGAYAELIQNQLDQELYKTFYNTLTRRFFKTRGVDADIEYVALDIEPTDRITHPVARLVYHPSGDWQRGFEKLLGDTPFANRFVDLQACAARLAVALAQRVASWPNGAARAIELLETRFYRERRCYLIGRLLGDDRFGPIVIALTNGEQGVEADALIVDREDFSQLVGFTRSYFLADFETVGDAVVFLQTLSPRKPVDEWYAMLGRLKQAKTERYRHFVRHFAKATTEQGEPELFRHADGERGMVMAVFTLHSYPLVFKLIRDQFAPPKNVTREEVAAKYQLVFKHDRAGRLIDAQEFRFLRFPRARFHGPLLDELLNGCSLSVYADGDDLVIMHCYVERKLRPLNMFVKEAEPELALKAIVDYGQSIKDLAISNIFPGDLLLKNFGVTRHSRAIFYDYDEICLTTECRFRRMPEPSDHDEEMHHGAWYHVDDFDVFPEQFPRFLGLSEPQRQALIDAHGEIFTVPFWLDLQQRFRSGQAPEMAPYPDRLRV